MWDEGSKHRQERQKEIVKRVERARFDASFFFRRTDMRMRWIAFLAASLFAVSGLFVWSQSGPAALSDEARGKIWWAHVQFLADDRLNGRDTGSAGYLEAAQYVARQFRAVGLKPLGTKGYFQPVKDRKSVV